MWRTGSDKLLYIMEGNCGRQMALWMAADQHSPPYIDIRNFGWEMKAGVLSPCIDPGPTGPPALMDVISCRSRAAGKACATICSCKK